MSRGQAGNSPYGTRSTRAREAREESMGASFPTALRQAAVFSPTRYGGEQKTVQENAGGLLRFLRDMRPDDCPSLTAAELSIRKRLIRLEKHGEEGSGVSSEVGN